MSLLHDVLAEGQLSSRSLTVVRILYVDYSQSFHSPVRKYFHEPIYNYALVSFMYLAAMADLNCSTKCIDKMWLGVAQQRTIMDDVSSHCTA